MAALNTCCGLQEGHMRSDGRAPWLSYWGLSGLEISCCLVKAFYESLLMNIREGFVGGGSMERDQCWVWPGAVLLTGHTSHAGTGTAAAVLFWDLQLHINSMCWQFPQIGSASTANQIASGMSPEESSELITGLERLSCEDKLRDFGCSTWRRKAPGKPYSTF